MQKISPWDCEAEHYCKWAFTIAAESCVHIRYASRTCVVRLRGLRFPRVRRTYVINTRCFVFQFLLLKIRFSKL